MYCKAHIGFLPQLSSGFLSRRLALRQTEFSNETVVKCIFHLCVRAGLEQNFDVKYSALEWNRTLDDIKIDMVKIYTYFLKQL